MPSCRVPRSSVPLIDGEVTWHLPHTFGWMRRPDLEERLLANGDAPPGVRVWETPAGGFFPHDGRCGALLLAKINGVMHASVNGVVRRVPDTRV